MKPRSMEGQMDNSAMQKMEELWKALQAQDINTVKDIISQGTDVNCELTDISNTPLHYCAQVGNVKLFKWLLSQGACIEKQDHFMDTVLHYACKYNQVLIAEVIFSEKENVDLLSLQGKDKYTPVRYIIKNRNYDLFKIIVNVVDIQHAREAKSQMFTEILATARENDQATFIELLYSSDKMSLIQKFSEIEKDQQLNSKFCDIVKTIVNSCSQDDKEKYVEQVVSSGSVALLRILLDNPIGYSVNCIEKSVSSAMEKEHFQIAEMLIDAEPDVEYQEEHFILCVEKKNSHLLKKMISSTQTFEFWPEKSIQNVIYSAIMQGCEESIYILANTLGKDFIKSCPQALDLALINKSLPLFKYFRDHGMKLSDRIPVLNPNSHRKYYIDQHPLVLAMETGDIEFAKLLFKDNIVIKTREDHVAVFKSAVKAGGVEYVKLLVSHDIVPKVEEDCVKVIKEAIKKQDENTIDVLLPLMKEDILNYDESIYLQAIKTGNIEFVKMLMHYGLQLDSELKNDSTKALLQVAVKTEKLEIVELCCQEGVVLTKAGLEIEKAIRRNCLDILKLLLRYGGKEVFEFAAQVKFQWSPLHQAVNNDNKEAVDIILDCDNLKKIIFKALQENGTSLIFLSIIDKYREKSSEIPQVLLQHGAKITKSDISRRCRKGVSLPYDKSSAFHILSSACERGDPGLVSSLIRHGVNVDQQLLQEFSETSSITNKEFWKEIVSAIPQTDTDICMSETLYQACNGNNAGLVQAILEHHHFTGDDNLKLLECVCAVIFNNNSKLLSTLLSKVHVDVNGDCYATNSLAKFNIKQATDVYGKDLRPIHIAAERSFKLCKVLLAHNANANVYSERGMLPINIAVEKQKYDIIILLLQHMKKSNNSSLLKYRFIANQTLQTPLFQLAKWTHIDSNKLTKIVKKFLDAGIDVNHLDRNGHSALSEAFKEKNTEVIEILLKKGSSKSVVQSLDWQFVEPYIQTCKYEIITELIRCEYSFQKHIQESNVNLAEILSNIETCSDTKSEKLIAMTKWLIENGAQTESTNRDGHTSLHICAARNQKGLVKVLIDCGADVNAVTTPQSYYVKAGSVLDIAIGKGHFQIVKLLLDSRAVFQSNKILIDIAYAIEVEMSSDGETTVGEIVDTVIKGCDVNASDETGMTALHVATKKNMLWFVEKLLQHNCNLNISINSNEWCGSFPLQLALKCGSYEIAETLIQNGAQCYFANEDMTLLHLMSTKKVGHTKSSRKRQNIEIIELIDNLNSKDTTESDSVCMQKELIRLLVSKGVDIDAISSGGWSALHYAANVGNLGIVEELVRLQCNTELKTTKCGEMGTSKLFFTCTAVQIAAKNGFIDIVLFLLRAGCSTKVVDAMSRTLLHDIIKNANKRDEPFYLCAEEIMKSGVDINCADLDGKTALNDAGEGHDFQIIKSLVEYGANVNLADCNGDTVLHFLCKKRYTRSHECFPKCHQAISFLIHKGANINAQNKKNETPLEVACTYRNLHALETLLEQGRDPQLLLLDGGSLISCLKHNDDKNSFLMARMLLFTMSEQLREKCLSKDLVYNIQHYPSPGWYQYEDRSSNILGIIKLLLRSGANPNSTDCSGEALLHIACSKLYILSLLLSFKANVECKNGRNETPLHVACSSKKTEALNLLLRCGANPNARNFEGDGILALTIQSKHGLPFLEYLMQHSIDVNNQNNTGWCALHYAVTTKSLEVFKFLLKLGCDLNIRINDDDSAHGGQSALHMAFETGQFELVELLLLNGADIFLEDITGKRPWQYCIDTSGNFEICALKTLILTIRAGANVKVVDLNSCYEFHTDLNWKELICFLIQSGCKIMLDESHLTEKQQRIIQSKDKIPLGLMQQASNVVRTNVRPNALYRAQHLPLPEFIIDLITFKNDTSNVINRLEFKEKLQRDDDSSDDDSDNEDDLDRDDDESEESDSDNDSTSDEDSDHDNYDYETSSDEYFIPCNNNTYNSDYDFGF